MSESLVVKPTGRPEKENIPWVLVIRTHDLDGTHYQPLFYMNDDLAARIVKMGSIKWFYGEPDWEERHKLCEIEKARKLREEAEKIEKRYYINV